MLQANNFVLCAIDIADTCVEKCNSEQSASAYLYLKFSNLIIRCKFPLAERTTRSIEVKDPNIETEVSQPPIMSPNESY